MAIKRGQESFLLSPSKSLQFTKARMKGLFVLLHIKINKERSYISFEKRALSNVQEGDVTNIFLGEKPPDPQLPSTTLLFHY